MARSVNDVRNDPAYNPPAPRKDVKGLRSMIRRASGQPFESLPDGEKPGIHYAPVNAWDEGVRYYLPIHEGVML